MPKNLQTTAELHLISHTSKEMLKILQARLQQDVNREPPDVQVGFRKGRETRDQIANICWTIEKAREFQNICFIDYIKVFDCMDHNKLWKILRKIWEYQATLPASWEIYMQVKKQQLQSDTEQWAGSKLGK